MKKILIIILCLISFQVSHAEPEAWQLKESNITLKNFQFHDGKVLDNVHLHYRTLGSSKNPAILLLHGTHQNGASFLTPGFANILFSKGGALDVEKYFIIIPDSLGMGQSSKPSDGLMANFPNYNYEDMVKAQHIIIQNILKIDHLRAVIGFSMGGMHTWMWASEYPDEMDIAIPMASQPSEMSGRNWMLRKMLINLITSSADWQNGFYEKQPSILKNAAVFYNLASNGGEERLHHIANTHKKTEEYITQQLDKPFNIDANDYIYGWNAARDYDVMPKVQDIKASILVINSADDERNPVQTKQLKNDLTKIPTASLFLIPTSDETSGHGSIMNAKLYNEQLKSFLNNH